MDNNKTIKQNEAFYEVSNLSKLIDSNYNVIKKYIDKLPEDLREKVIDSHTILVKKYGG